MTDRRDARQSGFTLVEVMISVALALLLILGVNLVFSTVGRTVGAGQALSAGVRDSRAAQAVLYTDLTTAVSGGGPALIIRNQATPAFRSREDELSDLGVGATAGANPILTIDLDGNNTEGEAAVLGEVISPFTYNHRNHRTDTLSFFARGQYPRQTGNDGTFAAPMTANEAWIWYGHLRLPNNAATVGYPSPGEGTFATNQNNYHANNWILGRMAMLLRPEDTSTGRIDDINGEDQARIDGPTTTHPLAPLEFGSPSLPLNAAHAVHMSRYDLGAGSIDGFSAQITQFITDTTDNSRRQLWWQRLLLTPTYAAVTDGDARLAPGFAYRFVGERLFAKPLDAAKAARLAPALFTGCSQFMVEYAGDFLTQENDPASADYGNALTALPDGIEDFVVDRSTGTAVRRTRWYGLPRDVAGSATGGANGTIDAVDVRPLRDVRLTLPTPPTPIEAPFERVLPTATDANYICVWGPPGSYSLAAGELDPPRPKMLRIIVTLDDPNGRLADGQTFEYVINLP